MNKKVIGLIVVALAIVSMGIWEFWGREAATTEEILVLEEPLPANRVLEPEDFKLKKVEGPSKHALKATDLEGLIGLKTGQFVPEETELRREFFVESDYLVGGDTGKAMMTLCMDWLVSFPQTMARGDKLCLYNGKEKVGDVVVAHVRDSSNNEVLYTGRDRATSTGVILNIEVISDVASLITISEIAKLNKKFTAVRI